MNQNDIIRRSWDCPKRARSLAMTGCALMHGNRTSTPDALLEAGADAVCAARAAAAMRAAPGTGGRPELYLRGY